MNKENEPAFDLNSIQKDFESLRNDVNEIFKNLKTDARHGLQDAVIGMNSEMHKIFPKDAIKSSDPINFIKKELQEHPITSAIILLSVGFLGARILSK